MELTEKDKEVFRQIQAEVRESRLKREACTLHNFERCKAKPWKWICSNCGCEEDVSFVVGYQQGLKHGKEQSGD